MNVNILLHRINSVSKIYFFNSPTIDFKSCLVLLSIKNVIATYEKMQIVKINSILGANMKILVV